MLRRTLVAVSAAVLFALPGSVLPAAEVLLPQARNAYYVDEPIEIAVAGLAASAKAAVELAPEQGGPASVRFEVQGDGSTLAYRLPPNSLAPGAYKILLEGAPQKQGLTISRGLPRSTMYVSQTIGASQLEATGGNFVVSNAFEFGLYEPDGTPSLNLRRRSGGMSAQETAVRGDWPSLIYMYWTGYVLHKPWGDRKSWAAPDMTENMRLMSLHVAQQLRRYRRTLVSVGTLDEPGLSWGKTPAGGMATGFPNWDEQAWYESRGWKYTDDPASRPDDDWLKYTAIRSSIIAEQNAQASRDLKTVIPDLVFSTDLYAPMAFMDGTDPWNQRVNDIPSTHVFLDWGMGKLGVIGGLYLEKAHDPAAKVAHAMNGQLFGKPVPQPATRYAYHLMLNGMLAAGLHSNWWLNYGGMAPEDLKAVNEPAARIGPMLAEMAPRDHDVALLWSFTEISLRCKQVTAKEAAKKTGEQIKPMVAALPENTAVKEGEVDLSAYSVGGNYRQQVLTMHQALNRGGYPTHILHERLLPQGGLDKYKTLVIVGQTFPLPADAEKAVEAFVARGGKLLVDSTTTVPFAGAEVVDADLKDVGFRWVVPFETKPEKFKSRREASFFQTNLFMDSFARKAVAPVKAAMAKLGATPLMTTDSDFLGCERHVGGEGQVLMVLNGYEKLPDIKESEEYFIYNHAPYRATYTLQDSPRPLAGEGQGVRAGSVVYLIEGLDWQRVSEVPNPTQPQTADFQPGEMKLYVVAPRRPAKLEMCLTPDLGELEVDVWLREIWMPWPFSVTLRDPSGREVFRVYRATDVTGSFAEVFPLGRNVTAGRYTVTVSSPVGGLEVEDTVELQADSPVVQPVLEKARVFDKEAISSFLAAKPPLTIAVGAEDHKAAAERLAAALRQKGISVQIAAEKDVWRKALYPRVWDPYVTVYRPSGNESALAGKQVQRKATIETIAYNFHRVCDEQGKELPGGWQEPGTLLTVTGSGCAVEQNGRFDAYEPGCKLYVNADRRWEVVLGEPAETKTTPEVRRKWSRPWHRLDPFVGAWHLNPQLPEAYQADYHLILLGDGKSSELVRALQASELLEQVVDEQYPGPGKALVSFAWSPFALEKNVILVGASDQAGLSAGVARLIELAGQGK